MSREGDSSRRGMECYGPAQEDGGRLESGTVGWDDGKPHYDLDGGARTLVKGTLHRGERPRGLGSFSPLRATPQQPSTRPPRPRWTSAPRSTWSSRQGRSRSAIIRTVSLRWVQPTGSRWARGASPTTRHATSRGASSKTANGCSTARTPPVNRWQGFSYQAPTGRRSSMWPATATK